MIRHFAVLAFVILVSGCTIVPDDIAVPEGTNLVSYNKAVTGGDAVIGKTARWGGVIVGVENKENKTLVEVVNFPLNHYGRPNTREETIGRFKVELEGFVDPIHFEKGHAVTFVGKVKRPIAGMVGEQPYMYPLLAGENYHLWRESTVNYVHPMFFDYRLGWYSPYYYSFYRPYYSPFMFPVSYYPRYYYPRRVVTSRSSIGSGALPPPSSRTISRPVIRTADPRSGGARKNLD